MKKIDSIIRKLKFEDLKKALCEVRIERFFHWDPRGLGASTMSRVVKGQAYHSNYLQISMLSVVVRD